VFGLGVLWAVLFAGGAGLLALVRRNFKKDGIRASVITFAVNFLILLFVDGFGLWAGRPMMTFPTGLLFLVFMNLLILAIITWIIDRNVGRSAAVVTGWKPRSRTAVRKAHSGGGRTISAAPVIAAILTVVGGIWFIVGHNSGGNAWKASHIVPVTVEQTDALPPSSTSHMLIVTPGIAYARASQAMASGVSGRLGYNTYLNLGDPTPEFLYGSAQYAFPLEVDGNGNKQRLHGVVPGYIVVNGENPNATPLEVYGGDHTMKVDVGMGQGAEPDRWVHDHGYANYLYDQPQFQVDPQGAAILRRRPAETAPRVDLLRPIRTGAGECAHWADHQVQPGQRAVVGHPRVQPGHGGAHRQLVRHLLPAAA
jgi:hypothetical protein